MLFIPLRRALAAHEPVGRRAHRRSAALLLTTALVPLLLLSLAGCVTAPPAPALAPVIAPPSIAAVAAAKPAAASSVEMPVCGSAPTAAPRVDAPNAVIQMLAYADRMRALPSAELGVEIARLTERSDSAPAQMQLALALSATRVPADLARALGLLQRVIANPAAADAAPLQPLARTLAARYLEQRRVEDDRDRQAQQLRDVQRRSDQLSDRLEALRAIERSVARPANRSPGAPTSPANGIKPGP